MKASNGSRLANVQIVDIVKRGQRFYLAFITEYVESSNRYTVKIYGSDLTFQAPSTNTFKEGDPCLITFTTKDQIEIIKDLGL
ncbi:MAG: hypothetical protein EBS19_12925, partial [Spirochaetia bacterium]|nr:hypothetical protein [Spirochaetia bacterium]